MKYMETQQVVGVVSAPKDAKMDINWHKSPNAMIDDITGDIISTQAATILNCILRFTQGMKDREWCEISHAFFKRKTRAKRTETIAAYIKELTDNNLIIVDKQNGKINRYAINKSCKLWYQDSQDHQPTSTDEPYRFNRTSTDELMATSTDEPYQTSTDEQYPYKDNRKYKKYITNTLDEQDDSEIQSSETENKPEKIESKKSKIPFEDFWNLYGKKIDTAKSQKKWDSLSEKEQTQAMAHIPSYVKSTPDKKFRKNPLTYLNGKCWLDEIVGEPQQQPKGDPVILDMSKHPQNKPKPEPVFIDMSKHWTERFKNRVGAA